MNHKECVARGCALHAAMEHGEWKGRRITVADVYPFHFACFGLSEPSLTPFTHDLFRGQPQEACNEPIEVARSLGWLLGVYSCSFDATGARQVILLAFTVAISGLWTMHARVDRNTLIAVTSVPAAVTFRMRSAGHDMRRWLGSRHGSCVRDA